jgi:hypothetical protein
MPLGVTLVFVFHQDGGLPERRAASAMGAAGVVEALAMDLQAPDQRGDEETCRLEHDDILSVVQLSAPPDWKGSAHVVITANGRWAKALVRACRDSCLGWHNREIPPQYGLQRPRHGSMATAAGGQHHVTNVAIFIRDEVAA